MSLDLVNIIFGMKVRQARQNAGMTLTEFAKAAKLSPSYLTEIEKGRKYPKTDKIMKMAQALNKSYDELVSIRLGPSMAYLEAALASPFIRQFPFDEFGLDLSHFVELLTQAPDRASALVHAITEITRQFDMEEEHFLRAALRSYQEIHDNYFEELEEAAEEFAGKYNLHQSLPLSLADLERIITEEFGYTLDHEKLAANPALAGYRSVLISGRQPTLLLNNRLLPRQIKFLLAREIGYRVLDLKERSLTSTPDQVESFRQVLNDFKASYFGGALLMPQGPLTADLDQFLQMPAFQPQPLLDMLERYDATPEMLLYRFSELIPQFFGVSMHFLRMHDDGQSYRLYKQLNMSRLLVPSGINLREHFCRRWLTVRLLRELRAKQATNGHTDTPHVGVQLSEFLDSKDRFLCIGFSRPLVLRPTVNSVVIVGFRVDNELQNTMRFLHDPQIPQVVINQTCERCPLTPEQCAVRAVPPTRYQAEQTLRARQAALNQLLAELRG